ncbi:hypothetical protein OESDEN_12205 [Oesophagostomum dentatum]|uniref:Uncharacterized protein n=1 Tax=Oesophagostomum dentatum TaxID=61180 RepID=A0A0B1SVT3_OESDE|nr:hypothetical protein OESDEN_12205 [Oesophagostomum dentatum]
MEVAFVPDRKHIRHKGDYSLEEEKVGKTYGDGFGIAEANCEPGSHIHGFVHWQLLDGGPTITANLYVQL